MVGSLQEEAGIPLPSVPNGFILLLGKLCNLLLQVSYLGRGVIMGQELVVQVSEGRDGPQRSVVQPHLGLSLQSEREISQLNGVLWDPFDLDSIDQLMESPHVSSGKLARFPMEDHRAAQRGDDRGAHLGVLS
ncbi:unnamed protein product [Linum trigynum]|uniref:Uncharacterized protein n=1 Tax=Linum trigynum TaxID=586398 RepID=A0AAV2CUF2_9ROSI